MSASHTYAATENEAVMPKTPRDLIFRPSPVNNNQIRSDVSRSCERKAAKALTGGAQNVCRRCEQEARRRCEQKGTARFPPLALRDRQHAHGADDEEVERR